MNPVLGAVISALILGGALYAFSQHPTVRNFLSVVADLLSFE